jgi:hypothetical protein
MNPDVQITICIFDVGLVQEALFIEWALMKIISFITGPTIQQWCWPKCSYAMPSPITLHSEWGGCKIHGFCIIADRHTLLE